MRGGTDEPRLGRGRYLDRRQRWLPAGRVVGGVETMTDLPFSKEAQTSRSPGRSKYCEETGERLARTECPGPQCRGRRSQAKGRKGQAKARRALRLAPEQFRSRQGNEETWRAASVRAEVKSGAQANPAARLYVAARSQSDAAKAVGDPRPFLAVAVPDGSQPLVMIRADELVDVVYALVEEWAK